MYVFVWVRVPVEVRTFWESIFSFCCGFLGSNSGHQVQALRLAWWCHLTSPRVSLFHTLSFSNKWEHSLPQQVAQFLACFPDSRRDGSALAFLGRNMYLCGMSVQMTGKCHTRVKWLHGSGIWCRLSFLSGLLSREPIYIYEENTEEVEGAVTDNQANCYQVKRKNIILPNRTFHLWSRCVSFWSLESRQTQPPRFKGNSFSLGAKACLANFPGE